MNYLIVTGFVLGLTSSLHCLGMCGPIAMAIPVDRSKNSKIIFGAMQYNIGRIFTYALLGIIVGSMGLTIQMLGVLQWLSIITGAFLILYAWRKYLSKYIHLGAPGLSIQTKLNGALGKVIKSKSPFKLLFLGGLNGLLPCGMVFAALLNALLTGDMLSSALAMAAFGLGTLPAMLGVTIAANKLNFKARTKLGRFVPYILTILGLAIVMRGLNLDIPFISPKVEITQRISEDNSISEEVGMSCCHSEEDCD